MKLFNNLFKRKKKTEDLGDFIDDIIKTGKDIQEKEINEIKERYDEASAKGKLPAPDIIADYTCECGSTNSFHLKNMNLYTGLDVYCIHCRAVLHIPPTILDHSEYWQEYHGASLVANWRDHLKFKKHDSDQQKIEISAQKLLNTMKTQDYKKALQLVNKLDSTYYKLNGNRTKLLSLASFLGYSEICAIMIKKGANVNVQDEHGRTPLMAACQNGHIEVVKLLLKNGADIYVKIQGYMTALDFAAQQGHKEILNLIVESEGGSILLRRSQSEFDLIKKAL